MEEGHEGQEYACNQSLVKALKPFIAVTDRKRVQDWLVKLEAIADGTEEAKARNEYMAYLVVKMQSGIITEPFNRPPPGGPLQPLSEVLENEVFDVVEKQLKINHCRNQRLFTADNNAYEKPSIRCQPSRFHVDQPCPQKGITASFAVFSNYDDNGQRVVNI